MNFFSLVTFASQEMLLQKSLFFLKATSSSTSRRAQQQSSSRCYFNARLRRNNNQQQRSLVHASSSSSAFLFVAEKQQRRRRGGRLLATTVQLNNNDAMSSATTTAAKEKLAALRLEMDKQNVSAFLIPSQDPHFSEYVSKCFERRKYISNFTGSAGTCLVTKTSAMLWTDGRYFLQAEQELDGSAGWQLMKQGEKDVPSVQKWLRENMESGEALAVDANVHSVSEARQLEELMKKKNEGGSESKLIKVEKNLVDLVWENEKVEEKRPGMPKAMLRVHAMKYAGKSCKEKLTEIRKEMAKEKQECLVVSALDDIMWLMNVRGGDAECNPVCLSHVLVTEKEAFMFVDGDKVNEEVAKHLKESGVEVRPYEEVGECLREMAEKGTKIWIDEDKVSVNTYDEAIKGIKAAEDRKNGEGRPAKVAKSDDSGKHISKTVNNEQQIKLGVSPIPMAKAIKNEAELEGMREAHLMDGVAMSELWCWLEKQAREGNENLNEFNVGEKVSSLRAEQNGYVEESFPSIVGEGPHGAVVHYRATEKSARKITKDSMVLLDSGGQFLCGTTDVTRTHHLGTPSAYEKMCYTRVLKGHIALDSATFPVGTPGMALDTFARQHLWSAGLDYRHGTGHGVGAALNVHEGPQSISPRWGNTTPIKDGMIVSNEPGYYEDGKFGIRIENLLICREAKTEHNFQGKGYLNFECLTFIPIQTKLMDLTIMSEDEIAWVNKYHEQVWEKISPRVQKAEVKEWLQKATAKISRD
jgi:Xaa-Pro aminopeptidase